MAKTIPCLVIVSKKEDIEYYFRLQIRKIFTVSIIPLVEGLKSGKERGGDENA